jgi:hypothetical protein
LTSKYIINRAFNIWHALKQRRVSAVTASATRRKLAQAAYKAGTISIDDVPAEDHADRPIPESTTSYTFGVKITGTGGLLQSVVEESEREMAANDAKRVAVVDDNSDALEASGPSSGATHTWLLALESGNTQTRRAYLSERGDKTPQLRDEVAVTGWGATVWHSGVITHVGTGTKRKGLEYTVYFSSDKKYIVCNLPDNKYGRGAVDERTSAVTLGWVFLVPTKEAGGEEMGLAAGGLASVHDA